MSDGEQLRATTVTDTERDHVVGVLRGAVGRGQLDLDEFSTRTDAALRATDRQQLNGVLSDLSGLHHPHRPRATRAGDHPEAQDGESVGAAAAPGASPPAQLQARFGSLRRTGEWTVAPSTRVTARFGSVHLDLSRALLPEGEIQLLLDVSASSVTIVLPQGALLRSDELRSNCSSLDEKMRPGRAGAPRVRVYGSLSCSSLTIKHRKRR